SARAGDCQLHLLTPDSDAAPLEIQECFPALCRMRAGPTPSCCESQRCWDLAEVLREIARWLLAICSPTPAPVRSPPECRNLWARAGRRGASRQAPLHRGSASRMPGQAARAPWAHPAVTGLQFGNTGSPPPAVPGLHE